MIVYAKSRWNRIRFNVSPSDASNISPYLKLIMYLNSTNEVEQYMLSKFLNEAYTVSNKYVTVLNIQVAYISYVIYLQVRFYFVLKMSKLFSQLFHSNILSSWVITKCVCLYFVVTKRIVPFIILNLYNGSLG